MRDLQSVWKNQQIQSWKGENGSWGLFGGLTQPDGPKRYKIDWLKTLSTSLWYELALNCHNFKDWGWSLKQPNSLSVTASMTSRLLPLKRKVFLMKLNLSLPPEYFQIWEEREERMTCSETDWLWLLILTKCCSNAPTGDKIQRFYCKNPEWLKWNTKMTFGQVWYESIVCETT